MIRALQVYDMLGADHGHREQCRRQRGISLCCTHTSAGNFIFYFLIVIELLSEHFELNVELNGNLIVLLEFSLRCLIILMIEHLQFCIEIGRLHFVIM